MGKARLDLWIVVGSEPIAGWVAHGGGASREFTGWVELTAAIEAARRGLDLADAENAA